MTDTSDRKRLLALIGEANALLKTLDDKAAKKSPWTQEKPETDSLETVRKRQIRELHIAAACYLLAESKHFDYGDFTGDNGGAIDLEVVYMGNTADIMNDFVKWSMWLNSDKRTLEHLEGFNVYKEANWVYPIDYALDKIKESRENG